MLSPKRYLLYTTLLSNRMWISYWHPLNTPYFTVFLHECELIILMFHDLGIRHRNLPGESSSLFWLTKGNQLCQGITVLTQVYCQIHINISTTFISVFNQLDAQNLFHNNFFSSLWYHHTCRCDDTRGCVRQFWPPDDEHVCSKHVEAWNKTYCETNFVHQVG